MSTYGPTVVFDLPSGGDAAQRVAEAAGVFHRETETWGKHSGEAPDDVRAAIGDALRHEFGGWVDPWSLLPRRVEYGAARIEVEMVPESDVYPEDDQEVEKGPKQRLMETLNEYHHEKQANTVAEDTLLAETVGDRDTLREELAALEQRGEVYQPQPNQYRVTSASLEGEHGDG